MGYTAILAYLVTNLTQWITHCIAFICLDTLQDSLKLAMLQQWGVIIKAQVGMATSSEKLALQANAKKIAISYPTHHSGMDLRLLLVTLNPSAMQPTSIKQTAHTWIKYCSLLLGCISTLLSTQSPQSKMV